MDFEFLKPILTANALATLQAQPILAAYFLGWLLACVSLGLLAWYISFVTGKAYRKPKRASGKTNKGKEGGGTLGKKLGGWARVFGR